MLVTAWWPYVGVLAAIFYAQSVRAAPLRLSMEEAVERATAASLDLGATRKDITVAEASVERSSALLPANPFLTVGAQHTSGYAANYSFSLAQEFEIAGQRRARMNAAQKEVEKATWGVKSAEQTLAATVRTAFVHALISVDRVTVTHQGVDATAELLSNLEQRKAPSDTQRIDLNRVRIQAARDKRTLAGAEQTRDNAFGALRRLLGLPVEQEIVLTGAPQTQVRELPTDTELLTHALERRPDLVALRRSLEYDDLHLALMRRGDIPNVTVTGTVARFEGATLAGGDISVPIPIFQRKAPEVHEALAEHDRTSLQIQNLEREVANDIRDARLACTVAADNLQVQQRQIVPMTEENLEIAQRLYDRGALEVADVAGVQAERLAARQEYLDALETYNNALIELTKLSGVNLTE